MTTIAYRKGLLVADTRRVTKGNKIVGQADKITLRKLCGVWQAFSGAGVVTEINALIDWHCNGALKKEYPDTISKKSRVKIIRVHDRGASVYEHRVGRDEFGSTWHNWIAIGSGATIASYHMRYRKRNAIEAVVKACKYSESSDWPIHYWMPGWKSFKVLTRKDWKSDKEYYRSLAT